MRTQSRRQTVLIVDPSEQIVRGLNSALVDRGYQTAAFATVGEAQHWLAEHQPNVVVVDGAGSAEENLDLLKEFCPSAEGRPVIFVVSTEAATAEQVRPFYAQGADDVLSKPLDLNLFLARLEVHLYYHGALVQLQCRNELLVRLAAFDELTGLFGRRAFLETLTSTLQRPERAQMPLALLLIDADNFKGVNEVHGYQGGDEALHQLAGRLSRPMRQEDLLGRYGGEEFCALIHDVGYEETRLVAERLRCAVEGEPLSLNDRPAEVTVSVGAAWLPQRVRAGADELLRLADAALYEAKRSGRNRTVLRALEQPSSLSR